MGHLTFKTSRAELITLYEMHLAFAVLFGADKDSKTSETMLEMCLKIMQTAFD